MLPARVAPMLARLAREPFDSPEYLFEVKWDGTRCIGFVERGRVRLHNRRFIEIQTRYPEFATLARLPSGTVVDGEVIVLHGGRPDFSRLLEREQAEDAFRIEVLRRVLPATYVTFDLLYKSGRSIMKQPLSQRREQLREIMSAVQDPHVLVPDHVVDYGKRYFREVKRQGLEGIMAKRRDSPYLPGKRSAHWLKVKVGRTGIFQVIGYLRRAGEPAVSALLLGEPGKRVWRYKGRVGSGLSEAQRQALFSQLACCPPLARPPSGGPGAAIWVAAGLRARVRFLEETNAGRLRFPVFVGVFREDRGT